MRILLIVLLQSLFLLTHLSASAQPVRSLSEAQKVGQTKLEALKQENIAQLMHYQVVREGIVQPQITASFTLYEIRDSFDLQSNTLIIPNHCVLVFNGGHVKNGKIVANDTKYCSRNVHSDCFDCEIEGVMERIGYVETASSVGMIKDSEIHARDNYNILCSVVADGGNLFLDGKYYVTFSDQISLTEPLFIFGGELVFQRNAFYFLNGGGLFVQGASITVSDKTQDAFFCGSKKKLGDIYICGINFVDCVISCKHLVNIRYEDLNSDSCSFGIKSVVFDHCVLNETGRCRITDAIITEKCSFTHNYYKNITKTPILICCQHSVQASPNDKTAYQYVPQNLIKGCPIVIDHNVFIGSPRSFGSYYCAALIKSVDCYFSNNYIQDIINYSDTPSATAYDAYLSCVNVYYDNNFVKDVMSFTKNGGKKPRCQIGKSKTNPLSFLNYPAKRIFKNNIFIVDGGRFLKMGADTASLYTDIFRNYSYIDDYIWESNSVIYKKARLRTGLAEKGYGRFKLLNNFFEVEEIIGSGLVSFRSDLQTDSILIQHNLFQVETSQLLPLLNQRHKDYYSRDKQRSIIVTDNTFINSFPKTIFYTGEEVIIKDNKGKNGVMTGIVFLNKVNGGTVPLDVKKMDVELRFNESVISTGGFRQFFSSNSMGTYSIDLNQVPEKGVVYCYQIGENHSYSISLSSIEDCASTMILSIPFHIKDSSLSYEWGGKIFCVDGSKTNSIVLYENKDVRLISTFYPNKRYQVITRLLPLVDSSLTKKSYRISYESDNN